MGTWVSKADDARRLIGRLVDEVHRGQIGRASELCDPVDTDALPVLMDAAHAADAAGARVAGLEAAARRVAWFLRETDPHWVRVDTDDGPEISTLLGLAVMLEAALAATDAGAGMGATGTGGAG